MMVKSGPANRDGQLCAPPDRSFGTIHSFNTVPRQFHSKGHCHTYRVRGDAAPTHPDPRRGISTTTQGTTRFFQNT
jgi:hypothetical protein